MLLNGAENDALREWLDAFQRELRTTIPFHKVRNRHPPDTLLPTILSR